MDKRSLIDVLEKKLMALKGEKVFTTHSLRKGKMYAGDTLTLLKEYRATNKELLPESLEDTIKTFERIVADAAKIKEGDVFSFKPVTDTEYAIEVFLLKARESNE